MNDENSMQQFPKIDEWKIIEEGFDPARQRAAESIFSIGNGHIGQRANFEETYSGDSLQGSYIGGIYYPAKTKTEWWKIGYPKTNAKVINSINWIGIDVWVNGEPIDLATCKTEDFRRVLNMKEGHLRRTFTAVMGNGDKIRIDAKRFISMTQPEMAAIEYNVKALNFDGTLTFKPYLNADVRNEDADDDERFWAEVNQQTFEEGGHVTAKTRKLDFYVCAGMQCAFQKNSRIINPVSEAVVSCMYVDRHYDISVKQDDEVTLHKYVAVASSLNHQQEELPSHVQECVRTSVRRGFHEMFEEQRLAWHEKWEHSDVLIEGDEAAQQGIRFNIFQLNQTYTGTDERLNIGPKGFTGEKYGGGTYWDTEAYCLPFYVCTSGQKVARQLLLYRYRQLPEAMENAQKLGFDGGAALYPMVTMNGEECHSEWEITFEEIHRNGAMAYAIYNYIRHTGDEAYLKEAGLEVLIAISRFWSQRFEFSHHRGKYIMLGVTGPNEYENNVNNNWYTSYVACWTLRYTMQCLNQVRDEYPADFERICRTVNFEESETSRWKDILEKVYLPEDETKGIFLQQDGYLDKTQRMAADLDAQERPLNQHWSWDRILRSCFIKQGDVVQGLYFFEHEFDEDSIRRNFDFYEPRTVHESSLSPCIHAILASRLGYNRKAYELYLRTARMDLDDYNKEVQQGLHITSMAGTWMAIIEGFAGKRMAGGELSFTPTIPEKWQAYAFQMIFKNRLLKVRVEPEYIYITCKKGAAMPCYIYGKKHQLLPEKLLKVAVPLFPKESLWVKGVRGMTFRKCDQ